MNMRLDEARHGHSAIRVERDGCNRGSRTALYTHEPAAFYPDVAQVLRAPQGDVFDENIQRHRHAPVLNTSTNTTHRQYQALCSRFPQASIQFTQLDVCCTLLVPGCINVLHSERIVMSVAPISSMIRLLLVLFGTLSLLLTTPQAQAQDKVLRVGTLKLIHGITPYFYEKFAPPGYTVEVIPFESPTDGKNAVLTGTVDTCIHGIAAFLLGAAAGEPVVIVAAATNRGMGIVADAKSDIKTIRDLKGKRVAIFPGSTQEVVILERLKAEGMSISDIQPIRLSFSDMAAALARGDIDAYVGAEPGPGISPANGTGRLIEYPYSTPIGSLNMILSASEKMIKQDPERIKMIVKMHEQATDYAMAHPEEMIQVAMQKLGQQRKSIEIAVPNVELTWKIDDEFIKRAKAYSELMVEKKQVRQAPDMAHAITEQFM